MRGKNLAPKRNQSVSAGCLRQLRRAPRSPQLAVAFAARSFASMADGCEFAVVFRVCDCPPLSPNASAIRIRSPNAIIEDQSQKQQGDGSAELSRTRQCPALDARYNRCPSLRYPAEASLGYAARIALALRSDGAYRPRRMIVRGQLGENCGFGAISHQKEGSVTIISLKSPARSSGAPARPLLSRLC